MPKVAKKAAARKNAKNAREEQDKALQWKRENGWNKLDAAEQARAVDVASACALMQVHTSLIKRPVIDWGGAALTVGWQPDAFEAALAQALT